MPNPPFPHEEPPADLRAAAKVLHEPVSASLLQEGFTESQALQIVGYVLATGQQPT